MVLLPQNVPVGAFAVFAVFVTVPWRCLVLQQRQLHAQAGSLPYRHRQQRRTYGIFRALFGFYAIYPLLLRYFNRCRLHHRLHRFIIQVILLQLFWKICNNISCSNQAVILTLEITTFLRYIAYFSFGMLAYIYHKNAALD